MKSSTLLASLSNTGSLATSMLNHVLDPSAILSALIVAFYTINI